MILWICGLSGSGKTSLANEIAQRMRAEGEAVVLLDGDVLRTIFDTSIGEPNDFSRNSRLNLAQRYSLLCQSLAQPGLHIVIATISLFDEVHEWNRSNLPNYFQVFLNVPLDELRRRDPKGIYQKFDNNLLENVAGLDLPIDVPLNADWSPQFDPRRSVKDLADELLIKLSNKGLL